LVATNLVTDKESGALRLPHRLDETTGMYRGKQIISKKEVKTEQTKHEKRLKAHKHEHVEGVKEPIHSDKVEVKKEGLMGRMTLGKAKSRSGFGGGA
jgi:hypothetical protein